MNYFEHNVIKDLVTFVSVLITSNSFYFSIFLNSAKFHTENNPYTENVESVSKSDWKIYYL